MAFLFISVLLRFVESRLWERGDGIKVQNRERTGERVEEVCERRLTW